MLNEQPQTLNYLSHNITTRRHMKTNLKSFAVIVLTFGSVFHLYPQGYIVPNGVTIYPANDIHVLQNPTNSNYTGFNLDLQSANTFLFNPLLDEGVRTFIVSANAPISLQPILAGSYTEMTYPNSYVFASGSPFYLGFYTGDTFPQNGIYSDPLFGWGRFVNNAGVIQLLDSALEYGAGGIYAGTQNIIPVPEPSLLILSALGALLLGLRVLARRQ
jgi:hypothetical protein